MFIELPILISVRTDDPRTIMGIVEDKHLNDLWYDDEEHDDYVLIAETSLVNVSSSRTISPSFRSGVCTISNGDFLSYILKPFDEVKELLQRAGELA